MRILFAILLSLCASLPAQAWEFAVEGHVSDGPIAGLDHRIGEATLSTYFGMDPARAAASDDATRPHFTVSRLINGENGDRPCFLNIAFAALDGGLVPSAELAGGGSAFDRCGPDGVRAGSREAVNTGMAPATFATGVAVCSGHNSRMEGIRLHFTQFDYGPVLDNLIIGATYSDEFTRPACLGRWSVQADCPAGQVIVGMRVFYSREGGPEPFSIIGLQPYCRALDVRQ